MLGCCSVGNFPTVPGQPKQAFQIINFQCRLSCISWRVNQSQGRIVLHSCHFSLSKSRSAFFHFWCKYRQLLLEIGTTVEWAERPRKREGSGVKRFGRQPKTSGWSVCCDLTEPQTDRFPAQTRRRPSTSTTIVHEKENQQIFISPLFHRFPCPSSLGHEAAEPRFTQGSGVYPRSSRVRCSARNSRSADLRQQQPQHTLDGPPQRLLSRDTIGLVLPFWSFFRSIFTR